MLKKVVSLGYASDVREGSCYLKLEWFPGRELVQPCDEATLIKAIQEIAKSGKMEIEVEIK